jgi:HPt (histidine-containing phosphotransfer) domain-containing protein
MRRIETDFAMGAGDAVDERPVDLVHLARQTFGDTALEAEVLALFRGQAPVLLSRIETAADPAARKAAAHTLKGSAQGIGAWVIARHAQAVEAGSPEALGALRAAVADTEAFIARLRK